MSTISVKWNKQVFTDLEVDLTQDCALLKTQLFSLTNVLPEKQKLLLKGKVLREGQSLQAAGVAQGATVMLMGTAEALVEPTQQIRFVEDLTAAERARMFHEKEGIVLPAGLNNLGNTCYLNSTLQCLRRISELRTALSAFRFTNPNDLSDMLTHTLALTFRGLESTGAAYTPLHFVTAVRQIFPQFNETDSEGNHKQQDSEEFLTSLLASISPKLQEDGQSLIQKLMEVEFQTTFQCMEETGEMPETRSELGTKLMCIIDNQSHPVDFLTDGIKVSLSGTVEKMSPVLGRNAVYSKEQAISKLPAYLMVQFVRFVWKQTSASAGTKATRAKILRKVQYPAILDAYDFCTPELKQSLEVGREMEKALRDEELKEERKAPPTQQLATESELGIGLDTGAYKLVGVVTHKGRSAESGHYVGWTHFKDDEWVQYDDATTSHVNISDVLQLSGGGDWHTAYILFYRKLQIVPRA